MVEGGVERYWGVARATVRGARLGGLGRYHGGRDASVRGPRCSRTSTPPARAFPASTTCCPPSAGSGPYSRSSRADATSRCTPAVRPARPPARAGWSSTRTPAIASVRSGSTCRMLASCPIPRGHSSWCSTTSTSHRGRGGRAARAAHGGHRTAVLARGGREDLGAGVWASMAHQCDGRSGGVLMRARDGRRTCGGIADRVGWVGSGPRTSYPTCTYARLPSNTAASSWIGVAPRSRSSAA